MRKWMGLNQSLTSWDCFLCLCLDVYIVSKTVCNLICYFDMLEKLKNEYVQDCWSYNGCVSLTLAHRWNITSLSLCLCYKYFFGRCSSSLVNRFLLIFMLDVYVTLLIPCVIFVRMAIKPVIFYFKVMLKTDGLKTVNLTDIVCVRSLCNNISHILFFFFFFFQFPAYKVFSWKLFARFFE